MTKDQGPARSFSGLMPFLVLLCALILSSSPALAEDIMEGADLVDERPGTFRSVLFYYENDLFAGTDEHYTSAFKISWLTKDLAEYAEVLPEWSLPLANRVPFAPQSRLGDLDILHNVGFSIGQNIYTPDHIGDEELIEDDRPYAGWLYASVALHRRTLTRLDTFETTLGMVGPSSLGEQTQNKVHHLLNQNEAKGWDHQLRDEPGLMFSWQQSRKAVVLDLGRGFGLDCIPHAGATVGNVFSYLNLGGEVRFGYHLPTDFGTSLISPGSTISAPLDAAVEGRRSGLHLFVGVDGRLMAQNIFLDGNTWKDSHHVDRIPAVADVYGGVALSFGKMKLAYTHAFRTREFEEQEHPQSYGSVSLRYSF